MKSDICKTKKSVSTMYILKNSQEDFKVCKTMFLLTLSISKQWVKTMCKELNKSRDISR